MPEILEPTAEHPITIEPHPDPVAVKIGEVTVAHTERALVLREGGYQPVFYIPLEDVEMTLLAESSSTTYCPYKGEANYYNIPAGGERSQNAVWEYREPFPAVEQIRGHVAFYPDRVDAIG